MSEATKVTNGRLDTIRHRSEYTRERIGSIVRHSGGLSSRRSGRTAAAIALTRANCGSLVVATAMQATQLKRQEPDLNVISVESLRTIGTPTEPLVFDHFAYEMHLVAAASDIKDQSELIEQLVEEVRDAREEAREARRVTTDLRVALLTLLDQVDYLAGACRPNELVGAVLDRHVIANARTAIAESRRGES